jgi:Predicted transcriptional regulator
MKLTYKKLWKLLIDKGLSKTKLKEMVGMSSATLAKLGKNEVVSTDLLLKICTTLNCNLDDIVESENPESDEEHSLISIKGDNK